MHTHEKIRVLAPLCKNNFFHHLVCVATKIHKNMRQILPSLHLLRIIGIAEIILRNKVNTIIPAWLKVAEHYKIYDKLFESDFLDHLDFKRYFQKNKNTFKTNHNRLLRHHKAFENLYKMGNGYPRLIEQKE